MCAPVEVIMTRADSNDPGYGYLTMYQGNKGLPPGDTGRYTRAIGLRVGPAASFSVRGWRMLMSSNGALGVRSEEHTSELQSLMRNSYAVFFLTKQNTSTYIKFDF